MANGFAIVVLAANTTLKLQGACLVAGQVMKRDVATNSGSSHTATRLTAVRIA